MKKRMILVDGNSLMYRAYFGMAAGGGLTQNSKGLYTNAIFAFARMMNHLIDSSYEAILVAFDAGKKTFRHDLMQDYKAGRSPMPDEMRMQIEFIKEYLDIMRIKRLEIPLFEADDIIGTMAKNGKEAGYHVDVYSSDKDLLQLIDADVTVHLTKKGMTDLADYNIDTFKEAYEIDHTKFLDLKALMGDKSDNLPGIPRIGEKKAIKYLKEYGSLDGIIEHKDEIKGADGENIRTYYQQAILSKKMATIKEDAPIGLGVNDIERKPVNKERLIEFYQKMEFNSLLKEISRETVSSSKLEYKIADLLDLKKILLPYSAIMIETNEYNYHKSPILAMAIANELGNYIIPLEFIGQSIDLQLFLSDTDNHKLTYDYKRMYVLLKRLGFELRGVDFDLLMASYILNPSIGKEEFKVVADYYGPSIALYEENVYGRGAKLFVPENEIVYDHLMRKVKTIHTLYKQVSKLLMENEQMQLMTDIEIPLSKVLGKMEFQGMLIDQNELRRQKASLEERIAILEKKIWEMCDMEFNIASPKQLGNVLFDTLQIPYPKKNPKSYSTDIEILKTIRFAHPVVDYIIDYRALTKLNSTYVSGLLDMIYSDGKVHTIFQQALTQTGRLSSTEPNLQNIPIKTEEGHMIRKMYIPSNPDYVFYSADYSQIELRVLAHMAGVKKLQEAFLHNEDIHTKTAKEIFGVSEVDATKRRQAKAVNFGIVYGISAFGLASDLGITNIQAAKFIDKYNEVYPEIDEFMKDTVEFCKETGYVKTLKNRKRFIPDINSKIYLQREFAKRTAMNAPIQGSAADIIKIAMIRIDDALEKEKLNSKMVVTVHDEVVLEVCPSEKHRVQQIVREAMTGAIKLSVPLVVDDSFGSNWYEVK